MLRFFENQYDKLNLENYIIGNLISAGNSFVYQAKESKTNKKVIIKLYEIHNSENDIFIQTITSLIYLNLPNLVDIYEYGIFSSEKISQFFKNFQLKNERKTVFIVAEEYVKNRDIDRMMKEYLMYDGKTQNCLLNPTIRSKIIFGVASIMKSLHKNKFLHRNLTLSHILIDENYEPKISFSINSQFLNGNFKKFHLFSGSHFFMAPEILLNDDYSFPADVYSYSVVVYKMFSNSLQFANGFAVNRFDYIRKILDGERLKRPQNISDDFWELIQKCWNGNPDERPTFDEITEILKSNKFALDEFGVKTDLNEHHIYQNKVESIQDENQMVQSQYYHYIEENYIKCLAK